MQICVSVSLKIVERLEVVAPLDPFLGLRALATYSGMSVRTLRSHLDAQPDVALPCYRVNGRVLGTLR